MNRELFKPDPHLPPDHFDVLVIGSGMGGLTSGLLLAREGFKVCVTEQHYRPGGYLHRFFRKRVPFDTGFHYLGGADEGGTLNQYLKFLGIRDKLHFHPLDQDGYDVIKLPGYEFAIPAGWDRFGARLSSEFPKEKAAIERFVSICKEICRSSFAYTFQQPPTTGGEYTELTLGALLRSLDVSQRLRAVICAQGFLYGLAPDETPIELHALVIDSMMQGPAGLDGGGDALARALVDAIKAHGGEVRTRTKVTALELKDGKAHCAQTELIKSVHTEKGEPIFARAFISNAHPHTTLDLLPPGALRPAYTNRVREMRNSISCIGGYYSTSNTDAPRRRHNLYCIPTWEVDRMYVDGAFADDRPGDDGKAIFITFPSDREQDWQGPRLVLSLGLMPWQQVARFGSTATGKRGPEYNEMKRRFGDQMMRSVESYVPEHHGRLTELDLSTPITNRDYVGAAEGGIYGLRHGIERWGRYSLHAKTKIDNLLLTGHSVLMPGIVGTTIGAFVTCSFLLGFDELFSRVAKA